MNYEKLVQGILNIVYQYALPVAIQNNYRGCEFILKTQILYTEVHGTDFKV